MVVTRSMTNYTNGAIAKNIIEIPNILDNIMNKLCSQNEWLGVFNAMIVFKSRYGVSDQLKENLSRCEEINEANKQHYFEVRLSDYALKLQTIVNLRRRVRLNEQLFSYIAWNMDTFARIKPEIQDAIRDTLFRYYLHEPLFQPQARMFLKFIFPQFFYQLLSEDPTFDDHEQFFFDNDY
jgi:hypothetical protein